MSTIREVSRRANVSPSTVSRVINGTTPVSDDVRRRVEEAIDALQYRPNAFARGLATNRSGGVGVSVNSISSPYYGAVLEGIEEVLDGADMHLMVSSGRARLDRERESIRVLRERRCDVLIVQVEAIGDEELIDEVASSDVPIVVLGRYVPELAERCVHLDNERGGAMAVEYLHALGHRAIGHVAGPLSFPDSRARLHGYRHALEAVGATYDERRVVEGDFRETGGEAAAKRLLERCPELDALFVANDQMAIGALRAAVEAGRQVPQDLSIVGFDDVLYARYLHPALTTVRQPLADMGRAAARLAVGFVAGREEEVRTRFEPEMIERASVARRTV